MLKIAITGAYGLIGSRIIELLNNKFQFIPLSSSIMDITNKNQVYRVLKDIKFDLFLHLAAYTNVAKAEEEKDLAYKINVEGTRNVFDVVSQKNKKFIYISTDFVFDGKNPPYDENSKESPAGFYGQTKFEGETIVKNQAMIVRISYPYRAFFDKKRDFFRTLKTLLEEKKTLKMITDSLMTPTFIDDIAYALKYLINNYSEETFHIVGSQALSPYKAAKLIAKKFKLPLSLIETITYEEYVKNKPGLPQYNDIRSVKNNFFPMSDFESGLEKIIHSQK
mgnify:CR=1 FL=1